MPTTKKKKQMKGFAIMTAEKRREIARMGGKASPGNFRNNLQRASEAGRKGGQNSWGLRSSKKKPRTTKKGGDL